MGWCNLTLSLGGHHSGVQGHYVALQQALDAAVIGHLAGMLLGQCSAILLAPPSTFSRCFNMDRRERVSKMTVSPMAIAGMPLGAVDMRCVSAALTHDGWRWTRSNRHRLSPPFTAFFTAFHRGAAAARSPAGLRSAGLRRSWTSS